jgi:hydrogenase maturation factor
MIVRKPQPSEFNTIINVFNYLFDELEIEEVDMDCLIDNIRTMLVHSDYAFFAAFENSRPVGFIGGYASSNDLWTKATSLHISTIYLMPSHRTTENLKHLLNSATEWVANAQLKMITVEKSSIEDISNFFENENFSLMTHYSKEL